MYIKLRHLFQKGRSYSSNPMILIIIKHQLFLTTFNRHSNYVTSIPLDGTHLVAVRGLTTKRYSSQERQWEELVGATLLCPIRTNRSSLTCRCQFPDSR